MSCKAGNIDNNCEHKPKFGQTHVLNIGIDDTIIVNVVDPNHDSLKTTTIFRPIGTTTDTSRFDVRLFFKTDWSVEPSEIPYK